MYPGKGTVVLIRPAQTFYERIFLGWLPEEASESTTATPVPAPTPTFDQLKEQAQRIPYDDLFRNPDTYRHVLAYYVAEVVTAERVMLDDEPMFGISQMRLTLTGQGNWEGEAVVSYNYQTILREGDLIEFVGRLQGLESFELVGGGSKLMPRLTTEQINLLLPASGQ